MTGIEPPVFSLYVRKVVGATAPDCRVGPSRSDRPAVLPDAPIVPILPVPPILPAPSFDAGSYVLALSICRRTFVPPRLEQDLLKAR